MRKSIDWAVYVCKVDMVLADVIHLERGVVDGEVADVWLKVGP